jgi:hypothetical protein
MLRRMLIGTAMAGILAFGMPTALSAQPPTPPQIVHKVDRGVRRVIRHTDRAIRRTHYRTRRVVGYHAYPYVVRYRHVRALCNDGRVHIGRTRTSACFYHGGLRG